ncbi:DUF2523 family protein [Propionivibrio limicola]|uniref:DUF2523 family protein n=1 Tax=Propionivibrio limicola TaxID=167645 RepID=UPI001B87D421|nr:DUF2523 family protein [Propionivibrio limicola]
MAALAQGFTYLLAKIAAALEWIGKLFVACFVSLFDMGKDLLCWCLEQVLSITASAIGAIDVSGMQSLGSWWSAVPAEVLNIMGLIGFGYAMGIIASAIGIRLVLQLIPFTRLGS